MAILAFASALLIEPPLGAETRVQQTSALERKKTRHPQMKRLAPAATLAEQMSALEAKKTRLPQMKRLAPAAPLAVPKPTPMPVAGSSEVGSLSPDRRWGTDVNWPDEWSKSSKASSASGHDKPPKVPKPPKGS
jgi:hypothetical protein